MLIPLSWLNEFVKIDTKNLKDLMWKITEVGLTCEKYEMKEGEIVLELEVTPNRPDLMSILGVAREIAAVTGNKFTIPDLNVQVNKIKNPLPVKITPDYKIVPRLTSVIIQNVKVTPSPFWLQKRIKQIGLRPINNLVDITNYVLWIYGSLLHVFDYDKIQKHQMSVELSKGGEPFRSLDEIDYVLPENAIIIKDTDRVIDLLPLKGGANTSASNQTKNVLLHSIVCDPVITRRTSQALKLKSDSSSIAERGLDPNGTPLALNHALSLILELAGGQVASEIIDHKAKDFTPWTIALDRNRLEKILGISISVEKIINILSKLNLQPELQKNEIICTIPTYRGDLKIEEDLIEEVARIYGYNLFPKTLPCSPPPVIPVAYKYSNTLDNEIKNILLGNNFSEIYTFSLISSEQLRILSLNINNAVKIENPVSLEFEYLRPTIIGNLISAVKINQINFEKVKLFELGKTYAKSQRYHETNTLSIISNQGTFFDLKGTLELFFERLGIKNIEFVNPLNTSINSLPLFEQNQTAAITMNNDIVGVIGKISSAVLDNQEIKSDLYAAEMNLDLLKEKVTFKKFQPIPEFPPIIEDLTLIIPSDVQTGDLLKDISLIDNLVYKVMIKDSFSNKITFRIHYQSPTGNLRVRDIQKIRDKIIKHLENKYSVKLSVS